MSSRGLKHTGGRQLCVIDDGNNDLDGIDARYHRAKSCTERPTLIKLRTIIGVGSLVAGTATAHGNLYKMKTSNS